MLTVGVYSSCAVGVKAFAPEIAEIIAPNGIIENVNRTTVENSLKNLLSQEPAIAGQIKQIQEEAKFLKTLKADQKQAEENLKTSQQQLQAEQTLKNNIATLYPFTLNATLGDSARQEYNHLKQQLEQLQQPNPNQKVVASTLLPSFTLFSSLGKGLSS